MVGSNIFLWMGMKYGIQIRMESFEVANLPMPDSKSLLNPSRPPIGKVCQTVDPFPNDIFLAGKIVPFYLRQIHYLQITLIVALIGVEKSASPVLYCQPQNCVRERSHTHTSATGREKGNPR
jgi:hypothetical protein